MAQNKVMKLWTAFVTVFLALCTALGLITTTAAAAVPQTEPTRNSTHGAATPPAMSPGYSPWSYAKDLPPTMKQRIRAEAHGKTPSCRHRAAHGHRRGHPAADAASAVDPAADTACDSAASPDEHCHAPPALTEPSARHRRPPRPPQSTFHAFSRTSLTERRSCVHAPEKRLPQAPQPDTAGGPYPSKAPDRVPVEGLRAGGANRMSPAVVSTTDARRVGIRVDAEPAGSHLSALSRRRNASTVDRNRGASADALPIRLRRPPCRRASASQGGHSACPQLSDTPVLDTLAAMTVDSLERCGLAPDRLILTRIAALAASDAPADLLRRPHRPRPQGQPDCRPGAGCSGRRRPHRGHGSRDDGGGQHRRGARHRHRGHRRRDRGRDPGLRRAWCPAGDKRPPTHVGWGSFRWWG